ncbi:hypothetical protein [Bacteroides nordii]|uniref:hypothetical protein n=1 Tax=Bacteroides nordii TaxID=291645 RepID=UPI00399A11F8
MFDKVVIKATVDTSDIDTIILRNYLEQCTEGDEVYYKSTAYANFDGCFIELRGGIGCGAPVLFASFILKGSMGSWITAAR